MRSRLKSDRYFASSCVIWFALAVTAPLWIAFAKPGWDYRVYQAALQSVRAGKDPYEATIAEQKAYFAQHVGTVEEMPSGYVYPPISTVLLKGLGRLPEKLLRGLYLSIYGSALGLQIWFCVRIAGPRRRWALLAAPLSLFFPGLVASGTVLGGNVAYILYAAILLGGLWGWKHNRWLPFFLAVLVASICKPPMLVIYVLAPLCERKEWRRTIGFASVSILVFAAQAVIFPTLFLHYLESVHLQVVAGMDFGCGLNGLASGLLYAQGLHSWTYLLLVYAGYAAPLLAWLTWIARKRQSMGLQPSQWQPLVLSGVLLLNPRIVEYDIFPATLPLLLLGSQCFAIRSAGRLLGASLWAAFGVLNIIGAQSWALRKSTSGVLVFAIFVAGSAVVAAGERERVPSELPDADAARAPYASLEASY